MRVVFVFFYVFFLKARCFCFLSTEFFTLSVSFVSLFPYSRVVDEENLVDRKTSSLGK